MRTAISIAFVFVSLILLLGCTPESHRDEATHISPIKGNQTILDELSRLGSLASQQNITLDDFAQVDQMTAPDSDATDELGEIKIMVKYNEYEHALHGLGFLSSYVETGEHVICPGHSLSHYYVFMRHGEEDLAKDNLAEAKKNVDAWIPLAEAYDKQYPSGKDINAVIARVQQDIKNIDAGNSTAGDDEIRFLVTDALCIEGAPHE